MRNVYDIIKRKSYYPEKLMKKASAEALSDLTFYNCSTMTNEKLNSGDSS